MSFPRTVLSYTAMVALLGVGFGLWCVIAPGEDRRREQVKNLHGLNPVTMEETKKRNFQLMQALEEAAATNNNIARSRGPLK
ncbi:ubiquinol-cytochrome-c reductase complex assembly factor 3 [Mastacembelus armatus]|uniref:Ubiquinol-cytochrome-c reductase complex assembly factor 3 n=1 Tax=Mastacembelus armatus TaxID=205130 RepID=A0A7N8WPR1_9TELE|nr:ubiquinol-cytochrome-c reductase complex assembly factor 3 [Mastacembelus armatus]